ncbi:hypothetical protein EVAR_50930_1 [Eumeta japonica]|uniref:Uncharacterized protein n=1 Tax=Eumeta variegata TaxID=151549 RepID=A0A4C1Y2I6_EUMVA|nr:hypothetical protein EVAR_50930_1 [Eumeta japonica]
MINYVLTSPPSCEFIIWPCIVCIAGLRDIEVSEFIVITELKESQQSSFTIALSSLFALLNYALRMTARVRRAALYLLTLIPLPLLNEAPTCLASRTGNNNEKIIDKTTNEEQSTEKEQQAPQIEPNNENTNDGIENDEAISKKNSCNHLSPKPCSENQDDFLSESSDEDLPLRVAKVENENESSDAPEDNDNDLESVEQMEDSKNLEYGDKELLGVTKTESIPSRRDSEESMSYASDSESMKYEIADWTRDEDKVVLEILKDTLTPTEMKDKTILEILEEKNVFVMLANSLEHKSAFDIRDRVLYLLDVLNKTAS